MTFNKGDIITFEYRRPNDGRRWSCLFDKEEDGWVKDQRSGTDLQHLSSSFRREDVVIWEIISQKKRNK